MANSNIWLDGIMGVVVGDALGSPAQFRSRENLRKNPVTGMQYCESFRMPAGSWTDDSSLTLATLASLVECEEYNLNDIADKFVAWLHKGEYTPFGDAYDIGYGCESGINRYAYYKDPTTSGGNDEQNNGNGSLMRIMPMCLYLYERQKKICTSENEAIHMIHEASGITHRHLRAQMACGLYYFCVKHIVDDRDKKSLKQCLQEGIDEGLAYYGQDIRNLTEMAHFGRLYNLNDLEVVEENMILTTGYVVDTIVAAIWNLITTRSYESCLLKAVNLGDDADTVGAVAGGLAGLYYGYDVIPRNWLQEIKKREWIEGMCEHFAECDDIDL